jgi:hypothetical protein
MALVDLAGERALHRHDAVERGDHGEEEVEVAAAWEASAEGQPPRRTRRSARWRGRSTASEEGSCR